MIKNRFFTSRADLESCIDKYFTYLQGDFELVQMPVKTKGTEEFTEQKNWLREPEPPTISGMAFYLGFESRKAFDEYELQGRYKQALKRGHLQIEREYEKKLHLQASAGAMFALKNMGWGDKSDTPPLLTGTITIEIIETGALPAATEQDVAL